MLMQSLRAHGRAFTLSVLIGISPVSSSHAAILAAFDFDGPGGSFDAHADTLHPAIVAAGFSDLAGTLTDFAGVTGRALAASAFNNGNAITLTLVSDPGQLVVVERVRFALRVSASGPTVWQMRIGDAAPQSGPATTAFTAFDLEFPAASGNGGLAIVLSGLGATATSGTLRLDNVVVEGLVSAVPLPPAFVLAGVPLAALFSARRSRQTADNEHGHSRQPSTSGK
jgi:hypothetical protein